MAKSLSSADAELPNSPEEVFRKHIALILPLRGDLEKAQQAVGTANGRYRAAIKAAKTDGVDQDALLEFLKIRKQDPEETTRHFKALNEMLLWGGVPVGTQLGMFEDGRSVATAGEDRKAAEQGDGFDTGPARTTDKSMTAVEADGHDAFSNNVSVDDNPYATDTMAGQKWISGWRLAEQQALDKAKAGKTEDPAEAAPAKAAKRGAGKRITAPPTAAEHPDQPPAA